MGAVSNSAPVNIVDCIAESKGLVLVAPREVVGAERLEYPRRFKHAKRSHAFTTSAKTSVSSARPTYYYTPTGKLAEIQAAVGSYITVFYRSIFGDCNYFYLSNSAGFGNVHDLTCKVM
jgi:hypothetical protein